jgi:hypothetical protein
VPQPIHPERDERLWTDRSAVSPGPFVTLLVHWTPVRPGIFRLNAPSASQTSLLIAVGERWQDR